MSMISSSLVSVQPSQLASPFDMTSISSFYACVIYQTTTIPISPSPFRDETQLMNVLYLYRKKGCKYRCSLCS